MSRIKMVVSFADGVGTYAKAMMRLEQSLRQVGFGGQYERPKMINDYAHIGSPFHKGSPDAVPYAFKAYSIKKAIEEDARMILWCDSPVYATKSITPIFDHIQEHGYLLLDNTGYSIGDYTSDACLVKWGMSRQEAFESKMIMACVMGFDIDHPISKEFLTKYINAASDGVSYMGDWYNNNLQVSNDLRVKGHRHDQSVASIVAKQMGLTITNAQSTFFAYAEHKGKIPIADTVSLWSEGIS
jgi:hypothetical protein